MSILRLQMYSDAFGLTMLRLYTTVFAGWVGLVLALAAIGLWSSPREWLAPTVVALALLGVFAMNIVNPEALVARTNLARGAETGDLDAWYLQGLSTDAVPTVVVARRRGSRRRPSCARGAWRCLTSPGAGLELVEAAGARRSRRLC